MNQINFNFNIKKIVKKLSPTKYINRSLEKLKTKTKIRTILFIRTSKMQTFRYENEQ
jgi:hypothetical protein